MRSVLFLMLGAALLVGLFIVLRPDAAPEPTPAPAVAPAETPQATPPTQTFAEASRTFDLEIRGGRITSGASTFSVSQGDLVMLRVTSDQADELHLHGYDVAVTLQPNQTASLAFQADRSGRFDLELHRAGDEIAAIEVQPK